jgi:hypothetical protein
VREACGGLLPHSWARVGHDEQWRKPVALCARMPRRCPDQWKGEWEYVKITRKEWVIFGCTTSDQDSCTSAQCFS